MNATDAPPPGAAGTFDVFIAYAGPDKAHALALRDALRAIGLRVFVDAADLRADATWDTAIPDALEAARMAAIVVGPGWKRGETWYAPEEAHQAIAMHRERPAFSLVPLRLRGISGRLPYGLNRMVGIPDADADWTATAARLDDLLAPQPTASGAAARPAAPAPVTSTHRLPRCGPHLFGRAADLAWLDAAWTDPTAAIAALTAWGGAGKTTIARHWLDALQARGWDGAARVFAWSFYSQGAGEDRQSSADLFIDTLLRWLGDPHPEQGDPHDKGERLAGLVKRQRTLLILDGVEPLQHPPGPLRGQLKDPALRVLLECLADGMDGLCLVTSRLDLTDLADRPRAVRARAVERLSTEAGVAFLAALGVDGEPEELAAAVEEYAGHALALRLLGSYLATVEGGDIRRRDVIGGLTGAEDGGDHARRVMAAYERWLTPADVAVLRLVGLFDRAVELATINALRAPPVIVGLTDAIAVFGHREWQTAVNHLRGLGLLARAPGDALDAHPLVREHFKDRLRSEAPAAWQAGHERLYRHFAGMAEDEPATLADMEPLYRAVLHGCAAGRYDEVLDDVYWQRIQRGNEGYTLHRLGAYAADLAALVGFFAKEWNEPQPKLRIPAQAVVLGWAGFDLRALGRLGEAVSPLEAGLARRVERADWRNAAADAGNLAELLLTLGRLSAVTSGQSGALERVREAIEHADRSGGGVQRTYQRTTLADVLHQRGEKDAAHSIFIEAERIQAERQPQLPYLYLIGGYRYGDLLLSMGQITKVRARATHTLTLMQQQGLLLGVALDHLLVGRAELAAAVDSNARDFALARNHLDAAVIGLRKSGRQDYQPPGLLARAALHRHAADWPAARRDLDEAHRIAARGGMRLYLADHLLESARLYLATGDRDAARAAYTTARAEVAAMGYHRRDPELAELAAALGEPAPAPG